MMKLYNSFTVSYYSVKSDKMMSAYMSEFVSYNVLDSDYLESLPKVNDDDDDNDRETILPRDGTNQIVQLDDIAFEK